MNVAGGFRGDQFVAVKNDAEYASSQQIVIDVNRRASEICKVEPDARIASEMFPGDIVDMRNGSMQNAALELTVLDYICGQTDRHHRNFFINKDGENYKLTGIDNDSAFGTKQCKNTPYQMRTLIPFITPELKAKIINLDPVEAANALTGLVDRGENGKEVLDSFKGRIEKLKQHVETIDMINVSDLNENTMQQLINSKTSPLGRLNTNCNEEKFNAVRLEVDNLHEKHVGDAVNKPGSAESKQSINTDKAAGKSGDTVMTGQKLNQKVRG